MGHRLQKCPCCGQDVKADLFVDRQLFTLGPMQRRLIAILRSAPDGLTVYQVLERLYANSASGGPETTNIIAVMATAINKKMRKHGIEIKGQGGPGSVYRLIETQP